MLGTLDTRKKIQWEPSLRQPLTPHTEYLESEGTLDHSFQPPGLRVQHFLGRLLQYVPRKQGGSQSEHVPGNPAREDLQGLLNNWEWFALSSATTTFLNDWEHCIMETHSKIIVDSDSSAFQTLNGVLRGSFKWLKMQM